MIFVVVARVSRYPDEVVRLLSVATLLMGCSSSSNSPGVDVSETDGGGEVGGGGDGGSAEIQDAAAGCVLLAETFSGSTLNEDRWEKYPTNYPATWSVTDGELRVQADPPEGVFTSDFAIKSLAHFNGGDATLTVDLEVDQIGMGRAGFYITQPPQMGDPREFGLMVWNGQVDVWARPSRMDDFESICDAGCTDYSSDDHRYLRIRADAGLVHAEASSNGLVWTELAAVELEWVDALAIVGIAAEPPDSVDALISSVMWTTCDD